MVPQFPILEDQVHIGPNGFLDPVFCLLNGFEAAMADGID
jgi:hypothetical protein